MRTVMCSYCKVQPVGQCCKSYCPFCYYRFQRIRRAYNRAKQPPLEVGKMHRTWNYWRQTEALDALYLDPIERAA